MKKHTHDFVNSYDGFVGFGLDRQTDEDSLVVYLQKFSDDELASTLKKRMSDEEINQIVDLIHRLMHNHFSEDEYHTLFLKDDHP
ncbi:MAG: cytoplasmic protein [Desulfobacteraceae bacterium]|nr:cytoplasmic protein [Desulfobacteraceae bacterium]MBU4002440.1 cytoplasmic protein [Pseudomonadota bacterium]MBU4052911.1 cytoplasmic protein [Pseudomonadota bacterium]